MVRDRCASRVQEELRAGQPIPLRRGWSLARRVYGLWVLCRPGAHLCRLCALVQMPSLHSRRGLCV